MENEIFPIVTFDVEKKKWKCLGTGYFINPNGAFVTAKHVFINSQGVYRKTLYSAHEGKNSAYIRPVKFLSAHNEADICIGMLGEGRVGNQHFLPPLANYCHLDLNPLKNGDKIYTSAYPNTISEDLDDSATEFTFTRISSKGTVEDFHEKGPGILQNRCYQTTMEIKSGASGGPVFKDGYIVGINSSGYDFIEDETPLSFITPIDYILDMTVSEKGKSVSIRDLIRSGHISVKKNFA